MALNEFSSLLESLGSLSVILPVGLLLLELSDLTMSLTTASASFPLPCSSGDRRILQLRSSIGISPVHMIRDPVQRA
jgi:hypothetical protein